MPSHICKEIEHKFKVSQLDSFKIDQQYAGDKISVTHNGTRIWFQLLITPADSKHKFRNMGVYLKYVDGPQGSISIRFSLYVMGKKQKTCVFGTNFSLITLAQGNSLGSSSLPAETTYHELPRRPIDLKTKGYIRRDDTILIIAGIYLSLDAFQDRSGSHSAPPSNKMTQSLYKGIGHEFKVSDPGSLESERMSVTHNNAHFWFQLLATPADSKQKSTDRMGVYLKYVDGPQKSIGIRLYLFVIGDRKFSTIFETGDEWMTLRKGDTLGTDSVSTATHPRLHIWAGFYISLSAFEEPSPSRSHSAAAFVCDSSGYIFCQDLNQSLAPKTSPTPIPEVTEEEQLAIAIQESEEEEKERQRQFDLFLKFNGPDFGGDQGLSDTELNQHLNDLVKGESTNTPPTPTKDQKLHPSLAMKEELGEQKQKDMAGSGALSTPVDAQQTLESPLNNSAPTNGQFALGLKELNGLVMGGCSDLVSLQKQILEQQNLMHARLRLLELQMLEQRRMLTLQRFEHQQIQFGQVPTSNFGVWPQFGLGMHESQRTPSYNPSHTISQQPMIMQQYSNSHHVYPSPQYQHQQIQYGQLPMSNLSVWPQYGLGVDQPQWTPSCTPYHSSIHQPMMQQWTNNYNPNQTFIQQPIEQQYSHSQHAYPSPQYLHATAPPQMCPQMPGADQQGNNTNQPDVGLLIDL